ncbi:MAG: RDD family protein [Clostridium sp.]|jgi:uncharacterized RDD family membrane protein YckC|nr:RDD family protein [Clostridium sp.]
MKKARILLRVLCGLVDYLIVLAPIQFMMIGIFQVSGKQADFFFQILFAVYGTLLLEYAGTTLGKYFGKLVVEDCHGGKPTIFYLGLRELSKSLYLIPYIGWGIGAVSLCMMLARKDGRGIHDFIGNTQVLEKWQIQKQQTES